MNARGTLGIEAPGEGSTAESVKLGQFAPMTGTKVIKVGLKHDSTAIENRLTCYHDTACKFPCARDFSLPLLA